MKHVWRMIYGSTSSVVLAALGVTGYCVLTHRPDGAIGGIALFLVGVVGFRMAWEVDILHRRRVKLAEQERLFEAERGVHEAAVERARRDIADEERDMNVRHSADRAMLYRQLEAERDLMQSEFDNKRATLRNAAFKMGFEMGKNGVAPEARNADVIMLPVGANSPTVMGTGTTNQ